MNYKEFKKAFVQELKAYLPAQYQSWEVKVSEIVKVNGSHDSVNLLPPENSGGTPNLYVDEFFSYYQSCGDLGKVCQKAAAIFVTGMDYLSRFEPEAMSKLPKDRVIFALIPQNGNEKLLTDAPHRLTLDLAVIYRILIDGNDGGFDSVVITDDIAEEMALTEEELYQLALENTPRILPPNVRKRDECLAILTNEAGVLGATVILYPDVLAILAEELGHDLFILPASIHEVFVVPNIGQGVEFMDEIVASANEAVIPKEETLANHAYYYHRETDKVSIAHE